ncbi:MAG TPA: Gfo/Idh/MocA family oxidoreductase [Ktedonobacteraceae bacterium]|jgi:predicted dehydrogenase
MSEKLRFGIIGCGVIGPTHAEAISYLPEATLVSVADIRPVQTQKFVQKYHVKAYTNFQEMLASEQLDVVDICTPSGMHGEHACLAMKAGCHVIVEKPMEITRERLDEMLHVQQETGRKLAVISQHRFDEASMQVHALIEEKALGRLVLGNAIVPWWRSQQYYDSGAWRGTWSLDGGGILMNQSIHSIDVLQWLMGPVKSVYAYTDTLVHTMETEDTAVAVLRFANGALGTISATTGAYPGVTTQIQICGDQGSAVIDNDKLAFLRLARDAKEEVGPYGSKSTTITSTSTTEQSGTTSNPAALTSTTHMMQIADMIRAIREDGQPLVDGNAARRPVDIILSIYESARTHKEVALS